MNKASDADRMRSLLVRAGVSWAVGGTDVDDRLQKYLEDVAALESEYRGVFGRPTQLLSDMEADPSLDPLVQTFAMPMTATMRLMVYCVLRGARIKSVNYEYQAERTSRIRVEVEFADGTRPVFESEEHWDALVLHHLGFAKSGSRPLIDGYFGFRNT